MTRHKHYNEIIAWAEGAEIQSKDNDRWMDTLFPTWHPKNEYRIKPKIVKREGWVNIYRASEGAVTRNAGGVHPTEEIANTFAGPHCAATVKIEWEETI